MSNPLQIQEDFIKAKAKKGLPIQQWEQPEELPRSKKGLPIRQWEHQPKGLPIQQWPVRGKKSIHTAHRRKPLAVREIGGSYGRKLNLGEPKPKKERAKNLASKTRPVDKPYEIWLAGDSNSNQNWEWRVLKKYQSPDQEAKNPYARWFCAVYSPITREQMSSGYELGDVYVSEITGVASKVYSDPSIEKSLNDIWWGKARTKGAKDKQPRKKKWAMLRERKEIDKRGEAFRRYLDAGGRPHSYQEYLKRADAYAKEEEIQRRNQVKERQSEYPGFSSHTYAHESDAGRNWRPPMTEEEIRYDYEPDIGSREEEEKYEKALQIQDDFIKARTKGAKDKQPRKRHGSIERLARRASDVIGEKYVDSIADLYAGKPNYRLLAEKKLKEAQPGGPTMPGTKRLAEHITSRQVGQLGKLPHRKAQAALEEAAWHRVDPEMRAHMESLKEPVKKALEIQNDFIRKAGSPEGARKGWLKRTRTPKKDKKARVSKILADATRRGMERASRGEFATTRPAGESFGEFQRWLTGIGKRYGMIKARTPGAKDKKPRKRKEWPKISEEVWKERIEHPKLNPEEQKAQDVIDFFRKIKGE